ncbi:MAG: GNAT family protein [Clostridioides difficile]|nr:GNAT family protein [Clostridioides difficile]
MKEEVNYFLKGTRVGLRELTPNDVTGNYGRWLNDKEVCKYNSHLRFPYTNDMLKQYVSNVNGSKENLVLAVIEMESREHIGNISLQNINYIDRSAELALLFGEKMYWGKGFAFEAATLIIEHGFNEINLERIYCGTSSQNERMQHLASRLCFTKEGLRRKAIFKGGAYYDIVEYGLLKDEFNSMTNSSEI